MNLPPARRNPFSAPLSDAPVDGGLHLQRCARCNTVQYPPRERCGHCLADALAWEDIDGAATLLACTTLAHSMEPWFAARLPWRVASLRLDAGPIVFAHLAAQVATIGARLHVAKAHDPSGAWCLIAFERGQDTWTAALAQLEMHA